MRTGTTLLIQSFDGLEPLGAFNQPVYRNVSQIREAVSRNFGPQMAEYFARPDIEPDGKRITWSASEVGEPKRWIDLSPEERAELEPIKQEYHAQLKAYQASLAEAPQNSPRYGLSLVLKQATRVPGPEYLYFLNGKPIVTFWGFKQVGLPEGIDPLLLEPGIVELPGGGAGPPFEPMPPFEPQFAPEPPLVAAAVPWWRGLGWLWWLLLGLLLLLLLLWLLLPRFGVSLPVWTPFVPTYEDDRRVLPDRAVPLVPGDHPPGWVAPGTVVPGEPVPGGPDAEHVIPGTPAPDIAPAPIEPQPETPPETPPNDRADKSDGGNPDKVDKPETPQDAAPLAKPTAPDSAPPANAPPGQPLKMPQEVKPGPADYMQGQWHSKSGLTDHNGKPLEEFYRFDKDGKGTVTVRGKDGHTCSGAVEATTDQNGRLSLKEAPNLQCSNGPPLAGATTTCKPGSDGRTVCKGKNLSDGSEFDVQMEHMNGS